MIYDRVRNLREDNDLTQINLSKMLGLNNRTYGRYELGDRDIPVEILIKLSKIYNVSVDYLLGRTKIKTPYAKSKIKAPDKSTTICERLRVLRKENNILQKELALILHTTVQTYSRYELGKLRISIKDLCVLADYYNVSFDYIAGITDETKPH